MTQDAVGRAIDALDRHDGFERADGATGADTERYTATITRFDAAVTVEAGDGAAPRYVVTVRMPMLSTAARGEVGSAVESGWFETLELRLADATMATRTDVDLADFSLEAADGEAIARFAFELGDPARGADVARTIVEYAEGTYVEGVVPGFEYGDPVASLLARAASGDGDGGRGPTPL